MSTTPWHNTLSTQRWSLAGLSTHRWSILVLSTQQQLLGLFYHTKVGILPLFRQGPLHLIFIQLLHNSTFITDYPGRPREHGGHPQLLEYILSSGSFWTITMGPKLSCPTESVTTNKYQFSPVPGARVVLSVMSSSAVDGVVEVVASANLVLQQVVSIHG